MKKSFCGQSGKAYDFKRVDADAPWAGGQGIALFAAPDAYGWRVINIVELDGRPHNIRPIWAFREAQRYGASAVFLHQSSFPAGRRAELNDLLQGLSPVVGDVVDLPIAA